MRTTNKYTANDAIHTAAREVIDLRNLARQLGRGAQLAILNPTAAVLELASQLAAAHPLAWSDAGTLTMTWDDGPYQTSCVTLYRVARPATYPESHTPGQAIAAWSAAGAACSDLAFE